MTTRRIAGAVALSLLVLAGLGYHFVFGYVTSTEVTNDITLLSRKNLLHQIGSNIVVFHDDLRTIVVDTQLTPLASSTRAKVDRLANAPISKVFVTHWHPDHSGGIEAFSADADVIAHQNTLRRLSDSQEGFGLTKPGSYHQFDPRSAVGLPTQAIIDRLDIMVGAGEINVVHYPMAHTDSDLVVYFQAPQVAVIGDLVWPNSFPYVDVHNGGSVSGLESALREVIAETKPGYQYIPGHGAVMTLEDIRLYLKMVTETRRWVEAQIKNGQTLDQMVATDLPTEWSSWGSSLVPSDVWIEMIYASRHASLDTSQ